MRVPGVNGRFGRPPLDVDILTYFLSSTRKYFAFVEHLVLEVRDRVLMVRLLRICTSNIFVVWVVKVEGIESFLPT